MPRLTIRQHGASASIPRHPIAGNLQKPEERKANRGWTAAVARRNSQYLQRIDFERVDGTPYAVTLTLPAWQMEQVTPVVMHRLIDVMINTCADMECSTSIGSSSSRHDVCRTSI